MWQENGAPLTAYVWCGRWGVGSGEWGEFSGALNLENLVKPLKIGLTGARGIDEVSYEEQAVRSFNVVSTVWIIRSVKNQ